MNGYALRSDGGTQAASKEEIAHIKATFESFDTDHSGNIDMKEFRALVRELKKFQEES